MSTKVISIYNCTCVMRGPRLGMRL